MGKWRIFNQVWMYCVINCITVCWCSWILNLGWIGYEKWRLGEDFRNQHSELCLWDLFNEPFDRPTMTD